MFRRLTRLPRPTQYPEHVIVEQCRRTVIRSDLLAKDTLSGGWGVPPLAQPDRSKLIEQPREIRALQRLSGSGTGLVPLEFLGPTNCGSIRALAFTVADKTLQCEPAGHELRRLRWTRAGASGK